jgi:hypothetical protein
MFCIGIGLVKWRTPRLRRSGKCLKYSCIPKLILNWRKAENLIRIVKIEEEFSSLGIYIVLLYAEISLAYLFKIKALKFV